MNTIKKLTLTLTVTLLLILLLIPGVNATTGTITVDSLRARTAPSTSSDVLRSVTPGDKLEIIETTEDWYKVKLSDGKEAYVYAKYVKLDEEITNEQENTEVNENLSVGKIKLEENTRIYILPLLFSNELSKVAEEIELDVIEKINNWVCVEYNGVQGWVLDKADLIETTTPDETTDVTPDTTEATNKIGYVNVSSAYVRKDADKSAEILTSMSLNSELNIIGEKDGWYEIKLSEGTGYIYGNLVSDTKTEVTSRSRVLRKAEEEAIAQEETQTENNEIEVADLPVIKTGYVSASAVNVRSSASTSSSRITSLSRRTEVNIVEELDGWYKIKLSNGIGYVSSQYVVDSLDDITSSYSSYSNYTSAIGEASETARAVVEYAMQYLDCEYVYGGSGPYSFDCSGFTMYVFSNFGVYLPHSATGQASYGQYVSWDNLQPGDLLIFRDRANSSIGHAGIYIGGGQFIHAANPSSDMQITSLDSSYYSARFVEGRRLV